MGGPQCSYSISGLVLLAAEPHYGQEKPVLYDLETRGDIYMARKMYREAIDTFRKVLRRTRSCSTRSASHTTR